MVGPYVLVVIYHIPGIFYAARFSSRYLPGGMLADSELLGVLLYAGLGEQRIALIMNVQLAHC